jgi:uncharacterized membrane protein YjfL (UPF0719 family)
LGYLLIFGAAFWIWWYYQLFAVSRLGSSLKVRGLLAVTPGICAALLWAILVNLGAQDVRTSRDLTCFYLALGEFWIWIGITLASFLNLSVRDDALERHNTAAVFAICGALLGFTLAFGGANVGEGGDEYAVVFSALLSTASLFVFWAVAERLTSTSELITVDRDAVAGLRLAGFLIAEGLVLGRAVAGTWVSTAATLWDFWDGAIPGLVPLGLFLWLSRLRHQGNGQSSPLLSLPTLGYGLLQLFILVATGTAWLAIAGIPK